MSDRVFKVTVKSENKEETIMCKSSVDKGDLCLPQIKSKIFSRFPALEPTVSQMYWLDSDSDQVLIFNEEDFQLYVEQANIPKDRLYVLVGQEAGQATKNVTFAEKSGSAEKAPRHVGVICDGCDNQITGYRYKCTKCPDFDLCMNCESKMGHPEHIMLRIPFVLPGPVEEICIMRGKLCKEMKTKHIEKLMKKCDEAKSKGSGDEKERKKGHHDRHPDRHHERHPDRHHRRHHDKGNRGNVLTNIFTYMNELANANEVSEDSATTQSQPGTSAEQKQQTPPPQCDQKPIHHVYGDNWEKVGIDVVKHFTNSFAKLLDPLGVVLEVDVQTKNKKEDEQKNETTEKSAEETNVDLNKKKEEQEKEKESLKKAAKELGKDLERMKQQMVENERKISSESPDKEWTVIDDESCYEEDEIVIKETGTIPKQSQTDAKSTQNSSTNTSVTDVSVGIDATILTPTQAPQPTASVMQPTSDFTYSFPSFEQLGRDLQKHIESSAQYIPQSYPSFVPSAPAPAPTPVVVSEPSIEKFPAVPQQYHPKPHINHAINVMVNMGFSNEAGWLTQLVESVDGNIPKALDLMQPHQR